MTPAEWLQQLLDIMIDKQASDMLISTNAPASLKISGKLVALGETALSIGQVRELVLAALPEGLRTRFEAEHEANFALSLQGKGRFRVSAFYQRSQMAMVIRRIAFDIPGLDALALPAALGELALLKRGLVFVVGGTGTGKSTTLASMIQHRNETAGGHIICIEDPIEYIHPHRRAIINQREVGIDTESFEVALKNALRQAPDVIMIGEIRTRETMEQALTFAETGHLCLATLHANNANQALERIIHFFPGERHEQVWLDLSLNLQAVVAQQLLPRQDGKGRVAAIEVLRRSPLIGDLVRKGEVGEIKALMARSRDLGMQTFDQALFELYRRGDISEDVALVHAESANDLRMMIKFADGEQRGVDEAMNAADRLSLRDSDDY
ncbi:MULTISPECIES: PilT/PilU family type 4a pilus ATPase [Modicisalibacter]|uniref:PilT/PilU family type 4a pilus ATPase n=1 Tax=Modicisalibacter TaxID=574347 RepID=UPI00100AB7F4|nr:MULTISPECIES: PilT/PilU family type 4a pilus ATPase [Halomonadaceae]MBZ9558253.1 PilT/PilU family type 4a pilus ATPase [Modicisalibacter sp. R2A 31.J]MBZ9577360.1 PilT/PilU family type 4a pilus ATPase [Modicisalibacter sp. MOD 31.J]